MHIMLGSLDMFSIGIGPSSSHTIGPMRAAHAFVDKLVLGKVTRVYVDLYGSLALTGEGHGTIFAILNGLCGESPKTIDPDDFIRKAEQVKLMQKINLLNQHVISFEINKDIILHKMEFLPEHANGMVFNAVFEGGRIESYKYYSVGGGFIMDEVQIKQLGVMDVGLKIPYPFANATELFSLCKDNSMSIAQLVMENELVRKTRDEVRAEALEIIEVMHQSVQNGINREGELPGGLKVRRRAHGIFAKLKDKLKSSYQSQQMAAMVYAMAVNEENASFRRIVTAPTNGAAGTIPGVLEYYRNFSAGVTENKLIEFILTAGAIGVLYKMGASISAAEVGCQGEIGVACSMAAGALAAVLGGTLVQIEKAAEIAMEHSLGMTCDPIDGLVQIPCIERNGVAATKAIDIARLVLLEDLPGKISLDQVIETMLRTGKDMSSKYKETALGGLATVNMVNC
jgi:L-serine dehydratase